MSLSNNPFALPAESRYPDINAGGQQQQQPQYGQQQQYTQQQQQAYPQQQQHYAQQYQQQAAAPQMYVQPTGYAGQASGFQPSSQFGQMLQQSGSQLNFGGGAGGQSGSSAFYNPTPQPYNNQAVADLDPFSGQQRMMGSSSYSNNNQQQQQQQQQPSQQQYLTTPQQQASKQEEQYGEHPRNFMKNNKNALEQWNTQAWGRVRTLFAQLEKAWEERKKLVSEWQTWNMGYDDRETCRKLRKEADENIDVVAAYTLQIKEVFDSYRHSSDNSSRAQVRQAMNQGLEVLPDWPLTLQSPPRLPDGQSAQSQQPSQQTSLFDNLPSGPSSNQSQNSQQQQPNYYGHQQQQQPQYGQQPQPQPQMYVQQTGYGTGAGGQQQMQPQQGYAYQQQQQQPQMYGQQQQYRQW